MISSPLILDDSLNICNGVYSVTTRQKKSKYTLGFSLAEVMIGMFVFSLLTLGLTKALIFSLNQSDAIIRKSVAHNIAYGYAEQMMALQFDVVEAALNGNDSIILKTSMLKALNGNLQLDDAISFGVQFEKNIIMDVTTEGTDEGDPKVVMPMRFTADAVDLNTGANPLEAVQITLNYSYLLQKRDADDDSAWINDAVHFVKSSISLN
jgi:Tfp pilus assembly protein PilV